MRARCGFPVVVALMSTHYAFLDMRFFISARATLNYVSKCLLAALALVVVYSIYTGK